MAGNADRFRTGVVRVRTDDDWESALPRGAARIATAATLPLLMRYRYPLRVPRAEAIAG